MRVSYSAEQRAIAKAENKRLATLAFGHKGGNPYITFQGPISEAEYEILSNAFRDITAIRAEKKVPADEGAGPR